MFLVAYLLECLFEESNSKHAILHTDPHQLGWIASDRCELYAMLITQFSTVAHQEEKITTHAFNPILVLFVGSNPTRMPVLLKSLAQSDIWLTIASTANRETGDMHLLLWLEGKESRRVRSEHDGGERIRLGRWSGAILVQSRLAKEPGGLKLFQDQCILLGLGLRFCVWNVRAALKFFHLLIE